MIFKKKYRSDSKGGQWSVTVGFGPKNSKPIKIKEQKFSPIPVRLCRRIVQVAVWDGIRAGWHN